MKTGLFFILSFVALWSAASAQIERGMSIEEARIELGREASKMEFGGREILIFEDGRRLEFRADQLIAVNGTQLPASPASADSGEARTDLSAPILDAEVVDLSKEQTITETVTGKPVEGTSVGSIDSFGETLDGFQSGMEEGEALEAPQSATGQRRLTNILITIGLEFIITFVVVGIAFSLSGFPILKQQLFVLSLAVTLVGAGLALTLPFGPIHPVRSAAGLLTLVVLIKPLTDVSSWATAVKIAVIARLITIVAIWGVMAALLIFAGL